MSFHFISNRKHFLIHIIIYSYKQASGFPFPKLLSVIRHRIVLPLHHTAIVFITVTVAPSTLSSSCRLIYSSDSLPHELMRVRPVGIAYSMVILPPGIFLFPSLTGDKISFCKLYTLYRVPSITSSPTSVRALNLYVSNSRIAGKPPLVIRRGSCVL